MSELRQLQRVSQEVDNLTCAENQHIANCRRHVGWGIHYERSPAEDDRWSMARDFYKAGLASLSQAIDHVTDSEDLAVLHQFERVITERRNVTAQRARNEQLQQREEAGQDVEATVASTVNGDPSSSSDPYASLDSATLSGVSNRSPQKRKKFSRGLFRKAIGVSSLADHLEDEEEESTNSFLWGYARNTGLSSRIKEHFSNALQPSEGVADDSGESGAATLRSSLSSVHRPTETESTFNSDSVEQSLGRLSVVSTTKELTPSSSDWVAPDTYSMNDLDTILGAALPKKGPMSRSESIDLYHCILHCAMSPLRYPELLNSIEWLRSLWTHLSHDEHNQIVNQVKKAKAKDVAIYYLECRLATISDHPYYTANDYGSHHAAWVKRETSRIEAYLLQLYGRKNATKKIADLSRLANAPGSLVKALKAKNNAIPAALTNTATKHSDMYRHLLKLFTSNDLARGQTLRVLPPIAQMFLEEYGERYSVNKPTRLLLYFEALVERLDLNPAHLREITSVLGMLLGDYVAIASLVEGRKSRPNYLTRSETELYIHLLNKLISRLEVRITAYRDYFEDPSSDGALEEAIKVLDLVHSAAESAQSLRADYEDHAHLMSRRFSESPRRSSALSAVQYMRDDLWTFVQKGNTQRYNQLKEAIIRVQNLELDMSNASTVPVSRVGRDSVAIDNQVSETVLGPVELLRICDFIKADLDEDAERYAHCFPFVDQELNLVSVSTKSYYQLLLDDVSRYLRVFRSEPPTADTFALSAKLKELHSTFYIHDKREEFEPLFMQFASFVEAWTESTGEKLNSWIVSACVLDKWVPLSDSPQATPISTCVVDTYAAIDQACRLYREHSYLDRPPAPSEIATLTTVSGALDSSPGMFGTRRFMSSFGDMINDAIQTFADHVLHSLSTELPLDENKKPKLIPDMFKAIRKRFTLAGPSDGPDGSLSAKQKRLSSRVVQAVGRQSIATFSDRFAEHKERLNTQTVPEKERRAAEMGIVNEDGAWVCMMPNRTPPSGSQLGRGSLSRDSDRGKQSPSRGSPKDKNVLTMATEKAEANPYTVGRPACVRLNNLEAARLKLDEFCSQVEEDFCQIMYYDEGRPVYQYERDFVRSRFKPSFTSLRQAITASVDIAAYWINPAILEALDSLIALPAEDADDVELSPTELYAPNSLVEDRLWPIIDFFETQLGTLFGNLYHNIGQRVIRRIWQLLVEDVERMMSVRGSSDMTLSPLQASILDQSLEPLRNFFHAEGQGIPRGFLQNTTASVQRVLQLYAVPTLSLIQLYKAVSPGDHLEWIDTFITQAAKSSDTPATDVTDPWEFIDAHVQHRPEGYTDSVVPIKTEHVILVLKTRSDDKVARKFVDACMNRDHVDMSANDDGPADGTNTPTDADLGLCSGYLQLRRPLDKSKGKKWRRFYFVLEQNRMLFCPTLAYYDSKEAAFEKSLPIGNLILETVRQVSTSSNERGFFKKFTIEVETEEAVHTLACPTAADRARWAHHLRELAGSGNADAFAAQPEDTVIKTS